MQPKFCSKCGNQLNEGDNFCRKCGAPIKASGPAQQVAAANKPAPNIPSYREVEERFSRAGAGMHASAAENPEGTVLLAGPSARPGNPADRGKTARKADIPLSFEEMLRGCSKVVDFGTGAKFELNIPAGLSPGDRIAVKNTGISDPDTGKECNIELIAVIG